MICVQPKAWMNLIVCLLARRISHPATYGRYGYASYRKGMETGLVKSDRYELLKRKRDSINSIIEFTSQLFDETGLINRYWRPIGTLPLRQKGCKLIDL